MKSIIAALVLAAVAGSIGYFTAPTHGYVHPGNIDAIMASPEYQQEFQRRMAQ